MLLLRMVLDKPAGNSLEGEIRGSDLARIK